jgi:hypothetical protein
MSRCCLVSLLVLAGLSRETSAFTTSHRSVSSPILVGKSGHTDGILQLSQGWDNWGPGETRPPVGQQRRGGREDDDSIERIEQEVKASAQARVDLDNVNRALQEALADDERRKAVNDQRAIALAAGTASGILMFLLSHTLFLSALAFGGVAFLANRDPTEEDSPAGAVARIVSDPAIRCSYYSSTSSDYCHGRLLPTVLK